jgi:hypothetical protein
MDELFVQAVVKNGICLFWSLSILLKEEGQYNRLR